MPEQKMAAEDVPDPDCTGGRKRKEQSPPAGGSSSKRVPGEDAEVFEESDVDVLNEVQDRDSRFDCINQKL